ncbi:hypothetical protein AN216_21610 [Streptomyces oceani]|uniref:Uncharacterized protein n=1 Tax=Streptomyces oceani TaxID=1075402 RepID=A0A1E7JX98_9ACTN|nr:hypothetical protein AN216_21610 [Streptomyces oceani]
MAVVPRPTPAQRLARPVRLSLSALAGWPARRWAAAAGAGVLSALAVGLPTAVVPNPFFARMTPVEWWNVPVLVLTALLGGVLVASYVRTGRTAETAGVAETTQAGVPAHDPTEDPAREEPDTDSTDRTDPAQGSARLGQRLGTASGLLAYFAVGCPVCNKLVLLLLGTSGAMQVWAPVQPLIAVLSLALLTFATVRRLAGEVACPVRA